MDEQIAGQLGCEPHYSSWVHQDPQGLRPEVADPECLALGQMWKAFVFAWDPEGHLVWALSAHHPFAMEVVAVPKAIAEEEGAVGRRGLGQSALHQVKIRD